MFNSMSDVHLLLSKNKNTVIY